MPHSADGFQGVYGNAVIMVGYTELQRSLRTLAGPGNFGIDYEVTQRLKAIGEKVAVAAPRFVSHKTGKSGAGEGGPLGGSVGVSVKLKQAETFSRAIYGGVQERGGWTKSGRGPHVSRGAASHWMSRAVESQGAAIQAEVDGMSDWVAREFDRL